MTTPTSSALELWRLEHRTDGREGPYRWMVWRIGPIGEHGEENHEWFATEDEARDRISELVERDDERSASHDH